MENATELRNTVAQTKPGKRVTITVLRNNNEMEFKVKIGELEKAEKQAKARVGSDMLGITVEKVTSDIARQLGLRNPAGVIITRVAPGSAAQQAGLTEGDIILRVGNTLVNDPSEFNRLVSEAAKTGEILLLVREGSTGRVGYIVVPLK